jgi:hypothetical protein
VDKKREIPYGDVCPMKVFGSETMIAEIVLPTKYQIFKLRLIISLHIPQTRKAILLFMKPTRELFLALGYSCLRTPTQTPNATPNHVMP